MNKVVLVFTGGTIAMKVDQSSGGAIPSLTSDDLINTLSGIGDFDNLIAHEYSSMPSPFITPNNMRELSDIIEDYLNQDDIKGVTVVHGTDVLEETAFYLNSTVKSNKPIVLTGSMKNASELGYDGLTNLVSSVKVCLSDESIGRGVLVVMNDTINSSYEVTKTHTLSLDTFKSIEFGPLGIIDQDEVIYYRNVSHIKKYSLGNKINDQTHLVKIYAGISNDYLEYLITNGAKGIVLEALGRGNVPPNLITSIDKAIKAGIHIVLVSRCFAGRVLDTYAYPGGGKDLTNHGCILGGSLNGQKARILLMLAISNNLNHNEITNLFKI